MIFNFFRKKWPFLPLLALPILVWLLSSATEQTVADSTANFSSEKINLALRRTADGLLRAAGDTTSRIPAIEQPSPTVWRVRLEQPISYEKLPALLQNSLDLYEIRRSYDVALRRCDDETIDLGFHQLDFLRDPKNVPCQGRELPDGCHFIEISFLENSPAAPFLAGKTRLFMFILAGIGAGLWFFRRQKMEAAAVAAEPIENQSSETAWLLFGNSRLDVAGQTLVCADGPRQSLTFRETKLLQLFATHPDEILERAVILEKIWADEGVLVGRSIDMFVSRLRKKLVADASMGLVAVHGLGYRLETGKSRV